MRCCCTPPGMLRYLRIPIWGITPLLGIYHPWVEPDFVFHHIFRGFLPLLDDDAGLPLHGMDNRFRISFHRFAEVFVRAGILQAFVEQPRLALAQPERVESLHRRMCRGLEDTQNNPVPFDDAPVDERVKQIAAPFSSGTDDQQAALIRKHLTIRLERVEAERGQPIRIYPPTREPADTTTRIIEIDPKVRFGRPALKGRGLPTDVLFERHQAGDSIADLATDYDITAAEVEEAIRYESRPVAQFHSLYGW